MKIISQSSILLSIGLLMNATLFAQSNNNQRTNQNKKEKMETIQLNKEAIRNLYENTLNNRKLGQLNDLIDNDYVGVSGKKGAAGFQEQVAGLINAFPDIQWNIQEIIGEGNKVVVRWKLQGTHSGQFNHIPATGKKIANSGIGFYEFKNGKIISNQIHTDRLGFLQELGVLPLDLATLSNKNEEKGQVDFIDKFFVPANAINEVIERMKYNRNFIKTLPGFIKDAAYQQVDENGNLIIQTIAVWENEQALNKAKEAVQNEYKRINFNPSEFYLRLNIKAERGIYQPMGN